MCVDQLCKAGGRAKLVGVKTMQNCPLFPLLASYDHMHPAHCPSLLLGGFFPLFWCPEQRFSIPSDLRPPSGLVFFTTEKS